MTEQDNRPLYEELEIHEKYYDKLDALNDNIRTMVLEHVEQIELLNQYLHKDRKRAKDLPRDSKGRITPLVVTFGERYDDDEPPPVEYSEFTMHELEDMDYFRQPALHYQAHGKYTNLYPNKHPQSQFYKFWEEEARRCREGYVREYDGEWIPGYYYWYLNYSPILQTIDILDDAGNRTGKADRIFDFPQVWDGDYMFFHYVEAAESIGYFGDVLKTRGRGYSLKCASMLSRNLYHFRKSKSYALASEGEFLISDGILNKAWESLDWIDEKTAWYKSRHKKNTIMHKRASYEDTETGIEKGYKSEIIGVTLKNNPEKARGKRGKLLLFEESGVFPGLLKAWAIARPSLEDGPSTFGFMVAFGTGGTEGAAFEGAEELFYNPKGYRILPLKNIYDKIRGKGICSFFCPEYTNRKNCYDKNGNSDVIKALNQLFISRETIRLNSSDPNTLTQEKADRAITPQESIMRTEGTLFPVADLKEYLAEISPNLEKFTSSHYIGGLKINIETGIVEYSPNADAKVVREFPIKNNLNKEGAVEIFKMPIQGLDGKPPRFRYIAGIDPYDDDHSSTNSLGSMFIMDVVTDEIVCEYTGRPKLANTFYENCLRLLKFYNATANYENDKKGLYAYFSNKNQLSYLADNPEILKDMEMVKAAPAYGNKAKGTNSGIKINAWGRRLQADWMLSSPEKNPDVLNLHQIRSIGYIKEAIAWNEDGNFDRVSAMGMLMILRENYYKYILHLKDGSYTQTRGSEAADDPFFNKNYKSKSHNALGNNFHIWNVRNGVMSKP